MSYGCGFAEGFSFSDLVLELFVDDLFYGQFLVILFARFMFWLILISNNNILFIFFIFFILSFHRWWDKTSRTSFKFNIHIKIINSSLICFISFKRNQATCSLLHNFLTISELLNWLFQSINRKAIFLYNKRRVILIFFL